MTIVMLDVKQVKFVVFLYLIKTTETRPNLAILQRGYSRYRTAKWIQKCLSPWKHYFKVKKIVVSVALRTNGVTKFIA